MVDFILVRRTERERNIVLAFPLSLIFWNRLVFSLHSFPYLYINREKERC